jgi:hypothetical protein
MSSRPAQYESARKSSTLLSPSPRGLKPLPPQSPTQSPRRPQQDVCKQIKTVLPEIYNLSSQGRQVQRLVKMTSAESAPIRSGPTPFATRIFNSSSGMESAHFRSFTPSTMHMLPFQQSDKNISATQLMTWFDNSLNNPTMSLGTVMTADAVYTVLNARMRVCYVVLHEIVRQLRDEEQPSRATSSSFAQTATVPSVPRAHDFCDSSGRAGPLEASFSLPLAASTRLTTAATVSSASVANWRTSSFEGSSPTIPTLALPGRDRSSFSVPFTVSQAKILGDLLERAWDECCRCYDLKRKEMMKESAARLQEHFSAMLTAAQNEHRSHSLRLGTTVIQAQIAQTAAVAESSNKDEVILSIQKNQDEAVRHVNEELAKKEFNIFELLKELGDVRAHAAGLSAECDKLKHTEARAAERICAQTEEILSLREDLLRSSKLLSGIVKRVEAATMYDIEDTDVWQERRKKRLKENAAYLVQRIYRAFRARLQSKRSNANATAVFMSETDPSRTVEVPRGLRRLINLAYLRGRELAIPRVGSVLTLPSLRKWIRRIMEAKFDADKNDPERPQQFADFVYDFYLSTHGARLNAEFALLDLCRSVQRWFRGCPRVLLFKILLEESQDDQGYLGSFCLPEKLAAFPSAIEYDKALDHVHLRLNSSASARPPSCYSSAFIVQLLGALQQQAVGTRTALADDDTGSAFVELESAIEVISRVFAKFPLLRRQVLIAQVRIMAVSASKVFVFCKNCCVLLVFWASACEFECFYFICLCYPKVII